MHVLQDKTPHHYIYIYSELVQQLQTVTRALQTTNSASTEQLKYFKQFFHTMVSFLLTVTLPWTEGQGKRELQPLIPLNAGFCVIPPSHSKVGPECMQLCFVRWVPKDSRYKGSHSTFGL